MVMGGIEEGLLRANYASIAELINNQEGYLDLDLPGSVSTYNLSSTSQPDSEKVWDERPNTAKAPSLRSPPCFVSLSSKVQSFIPTFSLCGMLHF